MARLTPDERERLAVFRWGFVVFLLFSALGALLGGWLADLFPGGNTQYQVTLVVAGAVGVVIGLSRLVLVAVEEVPDPRDEHADVEVGAIRRFAGRAVAILLLASFVGGFSVLGIRYINVILGDHFGVSVVNIGYVVTVDRLVSIAVVFMLIPLVRRTNEVVAAALFMVAILPLQVVAGLASSALLFAVPYLATRGLYYSQAPILDLVTNRHAPDRLPRRLHRGAAARARGAPPGRGEPRRVGLHGSACRRTRSALSFVLS
jgi:MFS family permease